MAVKQASMVLMGLTVSSGIGAAVLMALNMLIWATLALWAGSAMAFLGLGLIWFALRPRDTDEVDDSEGAPAPLEGQPEPA